jgi:hypothetical protein
MQRFSNLSYVFLICSLLLPLGSQADTDPIAPPPVITPAGSPKSEFIDDVAFGKDPFFPQSSRRPKVLVKTTTEPIRSNVPEYIVLKGISAVKDRKLAIINNYTVGEGEEFTLKTSGQPIKVKCIEIREKSAIVSANGATKELPLRSSY